ncbi:hypothetical protein [Agromyces marinus]|nr:hypothetical protein [Agromyces marinus]
MTPDRSRMIRASFVAPVIMSRFASNPVAVARWPSARPSGLLVTVK